jgi:hypothetical protein
MVDAANIGMVQCGQCFRLTLESRQPFRVAITVFSGKSLTENSRVSGFPILARNHLTKSELSTAGIIRPEERFMKRLLTTVFAAILATTLSTPTVFSQESKPGDTKARKDARKENKADKKEAKAAQKADKKVDKKKAAKDKKKDRKQKEQESSK